MLAAAAALLALGFGVSRGPTFGPHTTPGSGSWDGTSGRRGASPSATSRPRATSCGSR
jgi:hypothetical protein